MCWVGCYCKLNILFPTHGFLRIVVLIAIFFNLATSYSFNKCTLYDLASCEVDASKLVHASQDCGGNPGSIQTLAVCPLASNAPATCDDFLSCLILDSCFFTRYLLLL